MRVLGIPGSLRARSYNRRLLEVVSGLIPVGVDFQIFNLHDVPLYNEDLDTDTPPVGVVALRDAIRSADALLVATPEYNYGVSGVLKNALDWASRPSGRSVLAGKPVGMIGASQGAVGTARAQGHLKPVFHGLMMPLFVHGEVLVGQVQHKFDEAGQLTDAATRSFLERYVRGLIDWVRA